MHRPRRWRRSISSISWRRYLPGARTARRTAPVRSSHGKCAKSVCVSQVSPPAANKLVDSHTVSELSDLGDAWQLMYEFINVDDLLFHPPACLCVRVSGFVRMAQHERMRESRHSPG